MAINNFIFGYIVKEEMYNPDDIIFEEGVKGDWVYVVLEGKVKVKKRTPKGVVAINILSEGAIFGEVPFLIKTKPLRTATIVADGAVKLGVLDRERLEKEYEALSPQLKSLIGTLAIRLGETTKRVSLLAVANK